MKLPVPKLHYPNVKFPPYKFKAYPKKITVDGKRVTVNSAEEEAALLPKVAEPDVQPEPANHGPEVDERAEMFAKLEAAGVDVDKRWGMKRLQEELDKLNDNAG